MANTVLALLGDSTVPSLALLHSGQYDNLVFFYTKENEGKASMFSQFSKFAFPEINVEINEIPSINDPASIVEYAKKFCSEYKNDLSIFVTAGAKQTILPFVAQAPEATLVSLLHSPLRLIVRQNNIENEHFLDGIELNQILATRGWNFNGMLRKGNQQFDNVQPRFDAHTGRLSFTGTSWLRRENREDEIHSLSKKQKKKVQNEDQILTGELLQLAEDFGKNGANYSIIGSLRSPNRAVLPPFIRHEIPLDEEE